MACGVDLGMSILEGSGILAKWKMDIGGTVGKGSSNKGGEAEDILGTIAGGGGGGGGGAVMSTRGRWQRGLPEPPPMPLPVLQALLVRDTMVRLLSSLLPLLSPLLSLGRGRDGGGLGLTFAFTLRA